MDIQYLLFIQNLREATGGFLTTFFTFITNVAVNYWVVVPTLIIFWSINKKKGAQIYLTWGVANGAKALLKTTFCVYRPWIRSSAVHPVDSVISEATGYSFPSGHSTSASAFYLSLRKVYREYKGIGIFAIVMVLLTMFSRNYVGVHTPQDVIVGGLIGLVMTSVVAKLFAWVELHPEKDIVILGVVALMAIAMLLYMYYKPYPMDYVDGVLLVDPKKMAIDGFRDTGIFFGTVLGWFLERRYVNFDISGTTYQKVMRALVGGLAYVFVNTAVVTPIGKAINFGPVYFLLQTILVVLFMVVYPMIFKKYEKAHENACDSNHEAAC